MNIYVIYDCFQIDKGSLQFTLCFFFFFVFFCSHNNIVWCYRDNSNVYFVFSSVINKQWIHTIPSYVPLDPHLPSGFPNTYIWAASSEFGTYRLCEQRRFRRACASAQSRQNLRCSLIQAVSQEEPDRKADPWSLWMAGHSQLKFVMTECSKIQIRLTWLIYSYVTFVYRW